jgi:tripartite-type tricarboxylate transporter receptor subunit TctC
LCLAAIAFALPATPRVASALEYPTRPVTIIEPFGVSSVPDIMVRIMAPTLTKLLGQPIVVENVVGAGGMLGVSRVARSTPDGYHIVIGGVATQAYSQTLYKKPLYNAVTDFSPIMLVADQPLLLVTRTNLPPDNLQEFISYARQNQAKMQYGSLAGTGTANHIVCALFNATIGVNITHIPYHPPTAAAYQDLLAGRIDYVCPLTSGEAKAHIDSKQFKGIAVFSKTRAPTLPNVPTADEQGLNFEAKTWFAFFAPKGTPSAIIQKLHKAINDTIDLPDVRTQIERYGPELVSAERRSPEYLEAFVESEIKKWAVPIRASGAADQ